MSRGSYLCCWVVSIHRTAEAVWSIELDFGPSSRPTLQNARFGRERGSVPSWMGEVGEADERCKCREQEDSVTYWCHRIAIKFIDK